MIAVPALVYSVGAFGFFAIPYAILIYPFVFAIMPRFWSVCHRAGHLTAADFVRERFSDPALALASYTYRSGLRAPAMIAFVKDVMIYFVVIAAVLVIPVQLGGYGAVFEAAGRAFQAKGGASGLTLKPAQMLPFASLTLGSAFALFMYPTR